MRFNKRHLLGLLAALPLAWLTACGGGGDNGNDANVRLINASAGYASLDLYVAETKEISAVAYGTGSDYTGVKSGDSVENVLTSAGSTTELLNQTRTLGSGKKYTILAYGWEGALKSVIFTDDESAADSGKTKVGVYNGAVGAGCAWLGVNLAFLLAWVPYVHRRFLGAFFPDAEIERTVVTTLNGNKIVVRNRLPAEANVALLRRFSEEEDPAGASRKLVQRLQRGSWGVHAEFSRALAR